MPLKLSGNHELVQLTPPALEILFCRRDWLQVWRFMKPPAFFWRLYCPFTPTGVLLYQGKEILMQPGKLYVIAPETILDAKLLGDLDKFYIHFTTPGQFSECRDFVCELTPSAATMEVIEKISVRLQAHEEASPGIVCQIAAVCHLALSMLPTEKLQSSPCKVTPVLLKIWRRLQSHPEINYDNRELAASASMSISAFLRNFKQCFGISPQHFLVMQRVRMAQKFLVETDFSLEEIAEKCGFCDVFYFNRLFRKYAGHPPRQYRLLHEKNYT